MKSSRDIATRLQRQWQRKQFRLDMLTSADAWPKQYPIGLPTATDITTRPATIREHIADWRSVSVGEITWRDVSFRASSEPIALPAHWTLERPSDWIRASADRQLEKDYRLLDDLIGCAIPVMHDALILSLKLLQNRSREELLEVLRLAATLAPGEAQGRPLRLLAGHGVDTKFFERNRQLLLNLLDARFGGEVREQGLHGFLDASPDGEHWLLLMPLHSGLLPFKQLQVRSQELANLAPGVIQAGRVLVVENRQCWHVLPELDDTIAILGSGLDLDWLGADWLNNKEIAYWGDIDTWGITMLARARQYRPRLSALLCDRQVFDLHACANAVAEPVTSGERAPEPLTEQERSLYYWLLSCERGRLEQEYLPTALVHEVLAGWLEDDESALRPSV